MTIFAILMVHYDYFRFEDFLAIRMSIPDLQETCEALILDDNIPIIIHPSESKLDKLRNEEKEHYEIICLNKDGNISSRIPSSFRKRLEGLIQ